MVVAQWTGSYPNLCSGEWKLFIGGEDHSHLIPEDKRESPMGTYGTYRCWHFEDWEEVFEFYEDGKDYANWLVDNQWVLDLPADSFDVFCSFQAQDWRHGECGGCI